MVVLTVVASVALRLAGTTRECQRSSTPDNRGRCVGWEKHEPFGPSLSILERCLATVARSLESYRLKLERSRRPKRIILIRHGESQGNIDKTLYEREPDNKIPLTAKGQEQARACGRALREIIGSEKAMVFVSPFRRAVQTAQGIVESLDGNNQYQIRQDPRLREQEWGNYQKASEMSKIFEERNQVGRFYYRFHSGESGADVYDRVTSFWDSLFREFERPGSSVENYVIVSHGLTMRFFCMRYFRWSIEFFERVWNPENCEMWTLSRTHTGSYELTTDIRLGEESQPVHVTSDQPEPTP